MKIPAFVVYDTYTSLAMQNLQADHSVAHVIHGDWVCPMDFKWFSKVRDCPRHKLLQTIHCGNQDQIQNQQSHSDLTLMMTSGWGQISKWLKFRRSGTRKAEIKTKGESAKEFQDQPEQRTERPAAEASDGDPTAQADRSPGRECSVCSPHPHWTLSTWRCHRFQLRYIKPVNTLCAKKQRRFSVDANCSTDCGRALDSLS